MSISRTIPQLLAERVRKTPDRVAFSYLEGETWRDLSWRDALVRVKEITMGLKALGLGPEERVAILSGTRIEWILADLAVMCAAGATTTIYPSSLAEDCAYIIADSESVIVFAENNKQADKVLAERAKTPLLRAIVVFDGTGDQDMVWSLADLIDKGRAFASTSPDAFDTSSAIPTPDSLATLIYTSGTTGKPKGVRLAHDSWMYVAEAVSTLQLANAEDVQFLWLPLSHVMGKCLICLQMEVGFRTAVDGRVDRILENLSAVRPTFMVAVPRIFEKVMGRVSETAKQAGGLKWAIFQWALAVGKEASQRKQQGMILSPVLRVQYAVSDRLVFSKLRARFGGNIRFLFSGSAPLHPDVWSFFHAAGLTILEGYGLTESSAATCVSTLERYRKGTVGRPVPGTDIKIAEDGEILIKSRGVMRGYHRLAEATAEALDEEGYLHTGDIGHLEDGFLRITDRKKDLIKTSGGKYVAPQLIEGKFKSMCPLASQAVVVGNNRNFCVMLIAADPDALASWAKAEGVGGTYADWVRDSRVKDLFRPYVDRLNQGLASFESMKDFALLPKDLSVEDGELTPSLKVKRKVVETKYKVQIDALYTRSPSSS